MVAEPMNGTCRTGAFTGSVDEEECSVTLGENPFIYRVDDLIIGVQDHLAPLFLKEEGIELILK